MQTTRQGLLVVLACHGVFDLATGHMYAEHPEDRPIYEAQLTYAMQHLRWRAAADPLLVLSGGRTQPWRACAESRSYVELAQALGLPLSPAPVLEEYALTSIENLLFSLYVYHQPRQVYPAHIAVISWAFKRRRFEQTLEAINHWSPARHPWPPGGVPWPPLAFFPVGDLWGQARQQMLVREAAYLQALQHGLAAYYNDAQVQHLIHTRDVHGSRPEVRKVYAPYPLPF